MANDKEYNILLNKYNRLLAMNQDLQEQLNTKNAQWSRREEDFKIVEKLIRELCEDILAKDSSEMKLGIDYSWSSIPVRELILKSKKSFRQYCSKRTAFMRKIMDISESRLQEIESLNEQISIMKINPSTVSISQDELKKQIDNEKKQEKAVKKMPKATQDKIENGKLHVVVEDRDETKMEEKLLEDIADIGAMMQITPRSVPVTQTRRQVEKKRKRKEMKTMAHQVDLVEFEKKMSEIDWAILKVIGSKGVSRYGQIEEEFLKENPKQNSSRCRVSVAVLKNIMLLNCEKVSNPLKGSFNVYQLTDIGSRIYKDKFGKMPVISEMDSIMAEHDNCSHGYGIRLVTEMLQEKGTFHEVCDTNRKNPIKLGDGISYIPDIVCTDESGTKMYIEYECANHTQTNFNAKCNKMCQVTSVLNFIAPNRESMDKLCSQVSEWIKRRGATSLRHVTIRITSAAQIRDVDILSNSGWKFVYEPSKNLEPQVNF